MGSTVHEILQARILEWVTFPFSRGSSQPRDQTQVSLITGRFFTSWATGCGFSSVQFTQLSPSLCDLMNHSMPGLPVHHQTPRVHSDSRPPSQWCHPTISSSVVPFSSCSQSLPASESFPMSQLFAWGGQSTGVSALASVLPMNTQDWFPLGWIGWISLQSKALSREPTPQSKSINSSALSFLHSPTLTSRHDHWKNHNLD